MTWLALRMLTGDRAKYVGLVSAIAFSSMLMSQQTAIFCGLMLRTASVIQDMPGVDLWVMDPKLQNVDEIKPLRGDDLYRVRGVPGVAWAVRLYKGQARVRAEDGSYRASVLLGLDDATLVGAPVEMLAGAADDLRQPDAIILDDAGYRYLFPGDQPHAGKVVEMNDRRAVIVGICKAAPPFQTFPVVYTRYSLATAYIPRERDDLSFVVAGVEPGKSREDCCRRIHEQTGLQALPREAFLWKTIRFYIASTGIPVNFGITVALGFFVGTAVAGQTFYLFVLENLRHFGALKAMGVPDGQLLAMVVLQASVVGALGYAIGMGMTTGFFAVTGNLTHLRAFYLPWQVMLGTAAAVAVIIVLASALAVRRVWVLEPAVVFRG
jgi:putative ABC transport system permease protein